MFVAALVGVRVSFPEETPKPREPRNKDYRLSREVWYDGTVHWRIEQFVSNYLTLKALFPNYPTNKMAIVGNKPSPYNWIPLSLDFASEEEAIQYLNETLRSCEVMEVSHYYVD